MSTDATPTVRRVGLSPSAIAGGTPATPEETTVGVRSEHQPLRAAVGGTVLDGYHAELRRLK